MIKLIANFARRKSERSISGFAENLHQSRCAIAEVSDQEVKQVLSERESIIRNSVIKKINVPSVKEIHSNLLPSNNPTEDRRSACVSLRTGAESSLLTGVFDGHGGHYCSQAICDRLFYYLH